jgi:hypothetical protein
MEIGFNYFTFIPQYVHITAFFLIGLPHSGQNTSSVCFSIFVSLFIFPPIIYIIILHLNYRITDNMRYRSGYCLVVLPLSSLSPTTRKAYFH